MTDHLERYLTKYGVATVLALWLVYWLTGTVMTGQADQTTEIRRLQQAMEAHSAEQRFFLRAICLNVAQTESQRVACIPPGDRR